MSAFWLEEAAPVNAPSSNRARKGDSDFKQPSLATVTKREDAAKKAKSGRKTKHAAKGPGGGRFIAGAGDGTSEAGEAGAAVQRAFGGNAANLEASIRAFQKKHGLTVDGKVGEQTATALSGQYRKARNTAPGVLTRKTSRKLQSRHQPKHGSRLVGDRLKRASMERFGGGALVEGDLLEGFSPDQKRGKDGKWVKMIPTYTDKLKIGKSAGGSNGARFASSEDGRKWLVKGYKGNTDRVASEVVSNAIYREMGAAVPKAGVMRAPDNSTVLTYPLVEGKPSPHTFHKNGPSKRLGAHFMTDALLANWDVAGMDDDNVLWSPDGSPIRVDQGGTLEFRAMGQSKEFGDVPLEVSSMLAPGAQGRRMSRVTQSGMREQAKQIARTLTPSKIDQLMNEAPFADEEMRERVRSALKARVSWMKRYAQGKERMHLPLQLSEAAADVSGPAWLADPLREAAVLPYKWEQALHPRDQYGKFIEKIGGLPGGKAIKLDGKTTIAKDKDGSFRVTRSGAITKGFKTPEDAARAAADKSAKSGDADSLGGATKHAGLNGYLKAQKVGVNKDKPLGSVTDYSPSAGTFKENEGKAPFGGKMLTAVELNAA